MNHKLKKKKNTLKISVDSFFLFLHFIRLFGWNALRTKHEQNVVSLQFGIPNDDRW